MINGPSNTYSEFAKFAEVPATVKYALQYAVEDEVQFEKLRRSVHRNLNRKFIPYVNISAMASPKSLSHMYEWGGLGRTERRLFDLDLINRGAGKTEISMKINFRPSRSMVPLTKAQTTPNPATKAVVTKRYVFSAKAVISEFGLPTRISPRGDGFLAFDNPDRISGLQFTKKAIVQKRAGGPMARGSFRAITEQFFKGYGTDTTADLMTRYIRRVDQATSNRLNKSGKVTVGMPNFNQARALAKSIVYEVSP